MFHEIYGWIPDPASVPSTKINITSSSNRTGRRLHRKKRQVFGPIVLLSLFLTRAIAPVSCVLPEKADPAAVSDSFEKGGKHSNRRRLQGPREDPGDTVGDIIEDNNSTDDESRYHPCSLCQGLTLLRDKVPFPQNDPSVTCSDLEVEFSDRSGEVTDPNDQHGCRSTGHFVHAFSECCRASIPTFVCEQNVHDHIDQGFGPYGKVNPAVAPIIDPDHPLNVSVYLEFELLEDIDERQGR
mmetsp:Transcript_26926/g.63243  ORF Transcript_26926/g.63243 Transcript_26926/m.63243 type:complete len:240 (+) Transcript_26926:105-824(+)